MVVAPPAANKSNGKTLDARFTMLNQKRAEQVQRGTTARYAATMAKRTGKDAKKFAVSLVTRSLTGQRGKGGKGELEHSKRARAEGHNYTFTHDNYIHVFFFFFFL